MTTPFITCIGILLLSISLTMTPPILWSWTRWPSSAVVDTASRILCTDVTALVSVCAYEVFLRDVLDGCLSLLCNSFTAGGLETSCVDDLLHVVALGFYSTTLAATHSLQLLRSLPQFPSTASHCECLRCASMLPWLRAHSSFCSTTKVVTFRSGEMLTHHDISHSICHAVST